MLARKQCGRRNNRNLHPRHGRDKGRAERHLGFAKADIAANQAVHRLARPQIGDHIVNGA